VPGLLQRRSSRNRTPHQATLTPPRHSRNDEIRNYTQTMLLPIRHCPYRTYRTAQSIPSFLFDILSLAAWVASILSGDWQSREAVIGGAGRKANLVNRPQRTQNVGVVRREKAQQYGIVGVLGFFHVQPIREPFHSHLFICFMMMLYLLTASFYKWKQRSAGRLVRVIAAEIEFVMIYCMIGSQLTRSIFTSQCTTITVTRGTFSLQTTDYADIIFIAPCPKE